MTQYNRREIVAASGAALLMAGTARAQLGTATTPFSWDLLVEGAKTLANSPYVNVPPHPRAASIGYDALNKVKFREERTIWGDANDATGIRLFPLSNTANQPVFLHILENGQASPLAYDPAYFDMPADSPVAALGPEAGFSGFRLMTAARDADWLVFMGASYFRAAGAQKQYGLSARALTIDTSIGPEEFPRFTHFWLERTGSAALTIYALLDGPGITGAYRFNNRLDESGVHQDVDAALFPRRVIRELGLMPMTSMFWYDQAHRSHATDWRPEIHDSDGLLIRSADHAQHFRPLANPKAPRTSHFPEHDPQAFGLLQRDRDFDHYQDDGVYYDRRPSLWATPRLPLGNGDVRLYEFPTDSEYTDNVAAYWTPSAPVVPRKRIDLSYRLDWQDDAPAGSLATLVDIWRGAIETPGATNDLPAVRLVLDFGTVPQEAKDAAIWVELVHAILIKRAAYPVLGKPGRWRAVLDIQPNGSGDVDIRTQLRTAKDLALSEFIHYPLQP